MPKSIAVVLLTCWCATVVCGQDGIALQQPVLGVAVTADGLLQAQVVARQGVMPLLRPQRRRWHPATTFRAVSLRRLAEQVGEPDEMMECLAGLTRLSHLQCIPGRQHMPGDILLVGPAEEWFTDALGNRIGNESGRPILQLEDLAVAMRAFPPGRLTDPFVGCTIGPTREGLSRMMAFRRSIPRTVPDHLQSEVAQQMMAGLEESLGMANIRVFGISDRTNMARVMVEADYRMKLIAIGRQEPPVPMATFLSQLKRSSGVLQRWWFTPFYEALVVDSRQHVVAIQGQSVQLQTEDKVITPQGALADAGRPPSRASALYAEAFTRKYPEIAAHSAVFAQLRNAIDLLFVAAFCQREGYYDLAACDLSKYLDESLFVTEKYHAARQVACVSNAVWKGRRLIAPAGGGVSIKPTLALEDEHLSREPLELLPDIGDGPQIPAERWWWDVELSRGPSQR